jgi:hypothetical protein
VRRRCGQLVVQRAAGDVDDVGHGVLAFCMQNGWPSFWVFRVFPEIWSSFVNLHAKMADERILAMLQLDPPLGRHFLQIPAPARCPTASCGR